MNPRLDLRMEDVIVGQSCRPNISPAGRRRRIVAGYVGFGAALILAVTLIAIHAAWYWRTLVALPTMLAGFGWFQALRNTCVARAKEGMFEHDDFSKTPAAEEEVRASRLMAKTIQRDAVALGIVAGLLSALTAMFV